MTTILDQVQDSLAIVNYLLRKVKVLKEWANVIIEKSWQEERITWLQA